MVYLITSIGLSAGIFLLFQLFERWRVDTFPAIVINYGVAAGLGWSLAGGMTTFKSVMHEPWAMVALCMGLLFIYLFQLIARSTQENGVTVTSIAAKLSMVLPVALFLLFDPNDTLNWQKGLAIALAIPAIVLASWKGTEKGRVAKWIVPLVIFFGSGMIDLMFAGFSGPEHMRQVEHRYLFAALPLVTAFLAGVIWWMFQARQKDQWSIPSKQTWFGGIGLGVINFGSLYFLLETYDKTGVDRSAIMPVNNLGVILLSSALSVWLLKESLIRKNYLGLFLGALAIALLLWDAVMG
ncbi:MAG TPA: hypothetical protein DDZ19_03535 [Flavobacteriales bacterium]|nr:hypothetical protein [Flavobacteriales bacterium]